MDNKVERLEAALTAAYRRPGTDAESVATGPIMQRVRQAAREHRSQYERDGRFLMRFLSAAAVAVVVLMTVAAASAMDTEGVVALNTLVDDPVSATWDQPLDY